MNLRFGGQLEIYQAAFVRFSSANLPISDKIAVSDLGFLIVLVCCDASRLFYLGFPSEV